ncbi:cellulose synthase-like protein E1 [Gastrolobium bilobum]|uniref:cellulose synthase-like protein E1 n=1 Tax=Gastrolobium bilobum TaxID=150636 RepID=UPI002AAF228B|nr:cellulose synthase-like protein E1 [Gastrolobium bilobum]
MDSGEYYPLFETTRGRGRLIYRLFSVSLFGSICFILAYRFSHIPINGENGKWAWLGLLGAELCFGLYWLFVQALRWNLVFRKTFNNRLSQRYESRLPGVDIFVCTADPDIEPPMMVINTVLSVMAYDYPAEKLNVYLSDDAGADITFYALLEASRFAKHWLPFCKRFKVEPRSPDAYFHSLVSATNYPHDQNHAEDLAKLYEDMKRRIEDAAKLGRVPGEVRSKHNGFSQWGSYSSRRDHDTILQILLHKSDPDNSKDVDGFVLPTLVYLAREKRPQYHHKFKAGAINSLLRVSSKISNAKIILTLDCDMYSNGSQSVRDALCFFMDEEKGHEIAFVQFPQNFENVTKNDLYGSALITIMEVELHGLDGYGGPLYIGTCCFHRRDAFCGRKFSGRYKNDWNEENDHLIEANLHELVEESKALASCTYEENTAWGKEMGSKYGCLVEDVITGLSIQLQGWKSVYYNPPRKAFYGLAPTTLLQTLVQQKRWAEGELQIFFSKYSPALYGHGRISLGLQMGYCYYNFWAITCLPKLYYSIIPSLYLLKGIPLFPEMSSPWFIPFAYVILGGSAFSLIEFLFIGGTIQGWWNDLRMWLYKGTSSYLFAFMDNVLKFFGRSDSPFTVTAKIAEEDASQGYEKEVMEFGVSSPYFTVLATLALLNLFCLLGVLKELVLNEGGLRAGQKMMMQVLLCGFLVLINLPIYQGLFLRKDKGRLPTSLAIKSTALALGACIFFKKLN